MNKSYRVLAIAFSLLSTLFFAANAMAASGQLDSDARAALQQLYASTPAARALGDKAKGILIFPSVVKAGFIVGAQGGDGVLLRGGKNAGYFNTTAVSVGYQAGAQKFGYALFLMSDSAMSYLQNSNGWELGVGPSIVVVDAGMAKSLSTTTAHSDIYAFIFEQKGLMAGAGLQGAKISKIGN